MTIFFTRRSWRLLGDEGLPGPGGAHCAAEEREGGSKGDRDQYSCWDNIFVQYSLSWRYLSLYQSKYFPGQHILPKQIFPRPRLRARRARRWHTEESGQVGEESQSCEINWICFSKIVEKGKGCINKSCKTSWLLLQWTRWHVVYIRSQLWIRGGIPKKREI